MNTRQHDLQQLRNDYKTADSHTRTIIEQAGQNIRSEDGWIKNAREALVREVRKGRSDNARDIRESMMARQGIKK